MATEQTAPRAVSGRPKDVLKRAAILESARAMFFARGFAAVSIEAVAAAAGVSRMTVYGHFGDKETLFAEVITQQGRALSRVLSEQTSRAPDAAPSGLRAELAAFGAALLGFLFRPDVRAFNHLMEAEARHHRPLAQAFVDAGPRAVMRQLTGRLAAAAAAGVIEAPEPAKAARHLIGLFRSIDTASAAMGLVPPPTSAEISAHTAECISVFFRAYGGAAEDRPANFSARQK